MNFMNMSIAGLSKELKRRRSVREGFDDDDAGTAAALGISTSIVVVALLINLAIWIWGLVITIKYWKMLPEWAQIFAVLGLLPVLPFGPIVTLVVVYVGKTAKSGMRRRY